MGRSVSYANNSVHIAYSHIDDSDFSDDWGWYCEDFQSVMLKTFPSLDRCSKWVGREDKAYCENQWAYFGVSEYCGLVSMWVAAKDCEPSQEGLRDHWLQSIEAKFFKAAKNCFGQSIVKVGAFSNGECVFRIAA